MKLLDLVIVCSIAAIACAAAGVELAEVSARGSRLFTLIAGGFLGFAFGAAIYKR